uniref:Protein kinase domain-containing protein n=1 Tax=Macrostomum lignano TaxID=282301 RepID=A0A1I8F2Q7_9PLAT
LRGRDRPTWKFASLPGAADDRDADAQPALDLSDAGLQFGRRWRRSAGQGCPGGTQREGGERPSTANPERPTRRYRRRVGAAQGGSPQCRQRGQSLLVLSGKEEVQPLRVARRAALATTNQHSMSVKRRSIMLRHSPTTCWSQLESQSHRPAPSAANCPSWPHPAAISCSTVALDRRLVTSSAALSAFAYSAAEINAGHRSEAQRPCCCFARLNLFGIPLAKQLGLAELELSQSHLFFLGQAGEGLLLSALLSGLRLCGSSRARGPLWPSSLLHTIRLKMAPVGYDCQLVFENTARAQQLWTEPLVSQETWQFNFWLNTTAPAEKRQAHPGSATRPPAQRPEFAPTSTPTCCSSCPASCCADHRPAAGQSSPSSTAPRGFWRRRHRRGRPQPAATSIAAFGPADSAARSIGARVTPPDPAAGSSGQVRVENSWSQDTGLKGYLTSQDACSTNTSYLGGHRQARLTDKNASRAGTGSHRAAPPGTPWVLWPTPPYPSALVRKQIAGAFSPLFRQSASRSQSSPVATGGFRWHSVQHHGANLWQDVRATLMLLSAVAAAPLAPVGVEEFGSAVELGHAAVGGNHVTSGQPDGDSIPRGAESTGCAAGLGDQIALGCNSFWSNSSHRWRSLSLCRSHLGVQIGQQAVPVHQTLPNRGCGPRIERGGILRRTVQTIVTAAERVPGAACDHRRQRVAVHESPK